MDLNYCVECHQMDKANTSNCRWLQFNFCRLTCLQRFFAKTAVECDLCKEKLEPRHRVHVRDDVSKHIKNTHVFICDRCFNERSGLAINCHYCTKICYEGYGAQQMTITGLIKKYRCSVDCQRQVVNRCELTVCALCDGISKCKPVSCGGQMLAICSAKCLEKLAEREKIAVGSCVCFFCY